MAVSVLPLQARGLIRDADIEYALKQVASPVLRAAGLSPNRVKILVVDDEQIQRDIASKMLQQLGYQVITVSNGE